ncbi:MAG TPA: tetratricopeptide repeat protein [Candidatus Dormibacteraeota bacterium]|nr:tetratricopeptide repeat protein [Candidatus Dormibacteraeota bacterium]
MRSVWHAQARRYIVFFGLYNADPQVAIAIKSNYAKETLRARMSVDIVKQLDRAKRYVEKNRLDDAIEAYQAVLNTFPNHLESIQSLGDLYTMQNRPDRAAVYYGILFDRFTAPREELKALALYTRFLKSHQQPAERVARYALLLQKQNRSEESIEQYMSAALAFEHSGKGEEALSCFVRVAQLDSENRERHIAVAELAERLGNAPAAARGYLRAGQLTTENNAEALEYFSRAHDLVPGDRSAALLYAQGLLRNGEAASAAALLAPLAETERDATFLETYADALMQSGQLDAARAVLEHMTNQGSGSAEKYFSLADAYLHAGQQENAANLLAATMKSMLAARRESEFASAVDQLVQSNSNSIRMAEFRSAMYSELNQETKYFDALVLLFDLYLANGRFSSAGESLERLLDIDPYDSRNQERMDALQGKVDEAFMSRLRARLTNAATHGAQAIPQPSSYGSGGEPSRANREGVRSEQTLEDLLVQAEIFVQYSLQSKAIERLQRITELFPGEQEGNERLRGLFEAAHWWPQEGANQPKAEHPPAPVETPEAPPAGYAPQTLRDLAKISEINQNVFRQPSPRAMLSVAVNGVGTYLRATRCIAVVGTPGQPPQMASEFCSSEIEGSSGGQIVRLISQLERAVPDTLGGLPLDAAAGSTLNDMGLETALGVPLTDPETQTPAGMLIAGFAAPHAWKPNETYFLQSIGDQMLLCVHHTRLRSLVRTLAVADEKTGLLTRSSYIDCLLHESTRARTQGVPLALALLQVDGGPEHLRQQGEAPFERYMEQLSKAVQMIVRQTDLAVKYTSWALAFILPDTPLSGAQVLAQKLKNAAGELRPPWEGAQLTTSVAVAEAVARHEFDSEDIVTDLINRAQAGLEEARRRGGNEIVSLEMAKN